MQSGVKGGKVKWTIFFKTCVTSRQSCKGCLQNGLGGYESPLPRLCTLFCRYWEKPFEYQTHNINISDLGIVTLCLAFMKDTLLISKLFLNQQVLCPVSLIQNRVNSRRINSLASGVGPTAELPKEALASWITCPFKGFCFHLSGYFLAPAMLEIGCLVSQNAWPWPGGKCQATPECTAWLQNDKQHSLLRRRALCWFDAKNYGKLLHT